MIFASYQQGRDLYPSDREAVFPKYTFVCTCMHIIHTRHLSCAECDPLAHLKYDSRAVLRTLRAFRGCDRLTGGHSSGRGGEQDAGHSRPSVCSGPNHQTRTGRGPGMECTPPLFPSQLLVHPPQCLLSVIYECLEDFIVVLPYFVLKIPQSSCP